jgi:DNA-binding XRE family transcriptional regulator
MDKTLAGLLGVDLEDPELLRAESLVSEDRRLLRQLIDLRKARGWSQEDLAKVIGLTQPTIASFERYDSDPKLSTVRRYAYAVGALVCHHVEMDVGQIQAKAWPPPCDSYSEWLGVPATMTPNVSSGGQRSGQRGLIVNAIRADFAIAA